LGVTPDPVLVAPPVFEDDEPLPDELELECLSDFGEENDPKEKAREFRLPLLEDQPPHSLVYKLVDDPIARVDEVLLPALACSLTAIHTPAFQKE
jgi:hypothetical protein